MKLTAEQARAAAEALSQVIARDDPGITTGLRHGLRGVLRALINVGAQDTEASRLELIKKHGEPTEGGFQVEGEASVAFWEEYAPIAKEECEVDASIALSDIGHLTLGPVVDAALEPLVVED